MNSYIINPKTIALIPEYDQQGNLYSYIIEGNKPMIVKMSPNQIMEQSLLYYCSSMKGACVGSRALLGNMKMIPIVVCSQLEIYWFPCSSPYHDDCVWFSHTHVIDSNENGPKQTTVHLSFGHTITIELKKTRFEKKYDRATKLRYILTERIKSPENISNKQLSGLQICRDPQSHHYDINGLEAQ